MHSATLICFSGISIAFSAVLGFIPYLLHRNDKAKVTTDEDMMEMDVQSKAVEKELLKKETDEEDQRNKTADIQDTLLSPSQDIT